MINVSRFTRQAFALAALGVAMAAPASAGHDVAKDDPAVVADRLHHMGFVEWRRVKWSGGYWKIDNARRQNGHVYDLTLEGGSFDLVWLKREKI